jgi:Zn-dependent protease with chaperone function
MSLIPAAVGRRWFICLLCVLAGGPVWSQPGAAGGKLIKGDQEMAAALYVDLDARGQARIQVVIEPQNDTDGTVNWRRLPDRKAITAAVERAIGGTLRRVRSSVDEEGWLLTAESDDAFPRHLLLVQGRIEGAPFADALANDGLTNISITLSHPDLGCVRSLPDPQPDPDHRGHVQIQAFLQTANGRTPTTLRVDYGYGGPEVLRIGALTAALMALPILAIWWLRRRALRVTAVDPTAVWFSYARWSQHVMMAFWLVWFGCQFGAGGAEFWGFVFAGMNPQVTALACCSVLLGLPGLVSVLCAGMSHPVLARVRGLDMTPLELMQQALWTNLAQLLPLTLIFAGLAAMGEDRLSSTVLWFAGAFFGWRLLVQHLARIRQIVPQAITSGDLRDRIFALAERAGVKLGQIYLLPAGKMRSANAFAMSGNNVLLTDYLLAHLSRREIDAVMAHELGHLRHRHPNRLKALLFSAGALPTAIILPFVIANPKFERPAYTLAPIVMLVGLLLFYTVSRRFERVADAEAVRLTSDGAALIAALAKISRLNMVPLHWGRGGVMLTHPSTLRRVEQIAQLGGVPAGQVPEILADADSDPDRYVLPNAGPGVEGPLFSTLFKSRWSQFNGWMSVWITILTPALFAWVDRFAPAPAEIAWIYWLAGFVVTVALMLLAEDRFGARCYPELARKIAQRLAHENVPPPGTEGYDVQFSPDPTPRLYEGFTNWDIGLLVLTGDRLCYLGEQTRFALSRAQIVDVRIGPGFPALQPRPTLYITWRGPSEGTEKGTDPAVEQTFHMRSAASGTLRGISRDTVALAARVQAWRQEPDRSLALPPALTELPGPGRQVVTSVSPRAVATISTLLRILLLKTLLTLGVCIVLGLSFQWFHINRFTPGPGWYVLIVAAFSAILQFLPFWRYVEHPANFRGNSSPNLVMKGMEIE